MACGCDNRMALDGRNMSRDLRGDERDPERGLPQGRVRRTAVDRQLRG